MSIQKEDLLALAQALSVGGSEPHWRSAVSRAYYAAYHGCCEWHNALPMPGSNAGPNGGAHQKLLNQLSNPDASIPVATRQKSKILATKLGVLRNDRHAADYELSQTLDDVRAARACILATDILGKL